MISSAGYTVYKNVACTAHLFACWNGQKKMITYCLKVINDF